MSSKFPIPDDQKIISIEELNNWGYTNYQINKLVKEGNIRKLNKKNYENSNFCVEIWIFILFMHMYHQVLFA